ncbi:hypothetical protein, partial [Bradyrhizobium sp. LeoA1S1]
MRVVTQGSQPYRSLRQARFAQTLGNALKLGKEGDIVGPPVPILQPKGNSVIRPEPTELGDELWPKLGDGADQAARLAGVVDSATPSVNLTPAMTLGN